MSRRALETGGFALAVFAPAPDPLDPPAAQRLDQIHAPTLIVAGALDDPELLRAAGVMASTIPGAQKVTIPNAAHLPNMEEPEQFNEAVLAFARAVA
jgi:pimeloyl-ACP methyl ester carboxylesterase